MCYRRLALKATTFRGNSPSSSRGPSLNTSTDSVNIPTTTVRAGKKAGLFITPPLAHLPSPIKLLPTYFKCPLDRYKIAWLTSITKHKLSRQKVVQLIDFMTLNENLIKSDHNTA
ncbi:hypothetical protein AVEN_137599-2 [Araneus ventricosus]|nr:hypothetical protein AVEN_137599-2 [Araneus ventricosus]